MSKGLSEFYELVASGSPLSEKLPARGTLVLELPLRISTGDNRREHHFRRSDRVQLERCAVASAWVFERWPKGVRPLEVVLTRLAPRKLDSANLGSAFKAVIDQIATEVGMNDREFVLDEDDEGVRLRLRQETSRRYGVRIEVRW